ncbi:MAG: DUF1287 domain-containing protein [Proteobacteria bacterium]|nr:MAG: DUF1287 domain-containing protein [Pseudomonadota bacterium]
MAYLMIILLPADDAQAAPGIDLVRSARGQIGRTVHYDPGYRALAYPNGDVPIDRSVCTDVVIRAMRAAFGFDLQQHVHEDMRDHFQAYPQHWGLKRPDRNIDHRRVPNLMTFFKRQGWLIRNTERPSDYLPGDIVTCTIPPHLPHIMIVSDRKSTDGTPYVIHNIGAGTQEEDRLFEFAITGHYRVKFW